MNTVVGYAAYLEFAKGKHGEHAELMIGVWEQSLQRDSGAKPQIREPETKPP